MRAFDEDPPDVNRHAATSLPGASAPPPAAALVVARTEPGPCGAVRVRGEHADVGAELSRPSSGVSATGIAPAAPDRSPAATAGGWRLPDFMLAAI